MLTACCGAILVTVTCLLLLIMCGMHAGYTIHTVVALAHAGLIPLEHQAAVQQAFQQCAPVLSTTPESLTALMDKSLPTMIGLGGAVYSSSLNSLPSCCLCCVFFCPHIMYIWWHGLASSAYLC